jgi:flavin reductase (DIM6/NTAB) family NADH-FMN oxidoreductase RutF
MVQETDYCGLVSGRRVDKTTLFSVFYGTLKTAPMIAECPISMECKLTKVVDFPKHDIFIGEIVATYAEEAVLTDGIVDYSKVQPFFFTMTDNGYWKLGERFAQAWSVGKVIEKKQKT